MGGAGMVGGVGVGMLAITAGLSTEAPGTYPRDSPLAPRLTGVSRAVLGATAPLGIGTCVVGVRGGVGDCLNGVQPLLRRSLMQERQAHIQEIHWTHLLSSGCP